MRVCIVGGGKVGYYLAKTLHDHGHTPMLIEETSSTCRQIADWLDMPVIHGDGTKPDVLETAGVEDCQALIAVTGRDEDNLVACQIAKKMFKVKKTVARVNNPRNVAMLRRLGVDIVVSGTDNIARIIEREVEARAIQQLLSLADGDISLTQVQVPENFPFAGQTLAEIRSVPDTIVVSVTHGDTVTIPYGDTRIYVGDKVMVLANNDAFRAFSKKWKLG